jgi:diacylglycerol kinase (ATP)
MRVSLFVNPRSRRGRHAEESVRAQLARYGVECVPPGAPFEAIVVAGGDGTFVRCIPRALEAGAPIGLVPLGTFNDLAQTLGIPLDLDGACKLIAAGNTRRIDVAHVNGAYYVNEASIGLSSRIARAQRRDGKQRFGFLAFAATALQAVWFARPFHVEVAFDGRHERLKTVQLTVANGPHFGGFINVDDAAIDDGRLDLYAVDGQGFRPLIRVATAVLERRGRSGEGLQVFRSRSFGVSTRRRRRISADGEPAGTTPACFEVLPLALSVFAAPAKKFEQSP